MLKLFVATSVACMTLAGGAAAQQTTNQPSRAEQQQTTSVMPGRISDGNQRSAQDRRRSDRRQQQAATPTPEQVAAEVTPLVAVAAPNCQMTESALLGAREDGTKLFEVACATGPGYVIEAVAGAPKANDCVLQWSFGEIQREADPAADVGLQCSLPGNQNPVQVIAAYGAEAGLNCQVDKALATAVDTYEIGCAERDGWRLERTSGAWEATPCWELALTSNITCRFSTEDDARAEWPKLVVGTDAAACQIEGVAWMGDNPDRGSFYELKCASGEGVIVRFKDGAGQQTYSCIDAPQIFRKPCSLTTVEAPAAAPAQTGGRA